MGRLINCNKIKLIIWDLDNTVWEGILAENDKVRVFPEVKIIIKQLCYLGIISSVCSKNDYNTAKAILVENELWDWIVFPSISFDSKGERVREIIRNMNLREENVLYIDDNPFMINEVKFYNPSISTIYANEISGILSESALKGKEDIGLNHLYWYKQMEKKYIASKRVTNNIEFMKSINVKVQFVDYSSYLFNRIFELIERTNQLNFTKNRMTKKELEVILQDTSIECKCVRVIDDFCDNGIVGFYAKKSNKLIHYVFSCRILNMGIEQWVYTRINEPELQIVGKVASQVEKGIPLYDYITEIETINEDVNPNLLFQRYIDQTQTMKIYALGACDLYRMIGNLAMPNTDITFECNVFRGLNRSVNVGTEYIRSSFEMDDNEKQFCRKYFTNYSGELAFNSKMLSKGYDYAIFTFHDDFTYMIYENKKNKNLRVLRNDENIYDKDNRILSKEEEAKWLEEHFEAPHLISPQRFYDNLLWIRRHLSEQTKMILINGPIFDYYNSFCEHNEIVHNQIIMLNKVIDQFVQDKSNNAKLVDVNKYITSRSDIWDYIFHWTVEASYKITKETLKSMASFNDCKNDYRHNNVPIKDRKIVLIGNDKFTDLAYYALLANGYNNVSLISVMENFEEKYKDTYFFITDKNNRDEIIERLNFYGFRAVKDYILFQPIDYVVHWYEKV